MLALVKHEGWAILSQEFASPYAASGELVEIKIAETVHTLKYDLVLYFPTDAEENDVLRQFIQWITDYAATHLE